MLLAPLALAACGFAPAYGPGAAGARLSGRIAVKAPDTPEGYRLGARLEERLGRPSGPAATLEVTVAIERSAALTEADGAEARAHLQGRAAWRLVSAGGAALAQGEEASFAGAATGGDPVAGRAAEADAEERLLGLLADRIVARLLLLPPEALP